MDEATFKALCEETLSEWITGYQDLYDSNPIRIDYVGDEMYVIQPLKRTADGNLEPDGDSSMFQVNITVTKVSQ